MKIHNTHFERQGAALVIVMLIVLSITAIALVALRATLNEAQTATAFRFNRQAAYAAQGVATHMKAQLIDSSSLAQLQQIKMTGSRVYRTEDIKHFTGLTNLPSDLASDSPGNHWLRGDLSRSVQQLGSYEGLHELLLDTVGMSEQGNYCSYKLTLHAVAIVGRPPQSTGGVLTLAEANARASARKREMATIRLDNLWGCNDNAF
ncbi:MAG: pilus assembly PilX N-terminal domain-containing protein [Proteobacteria bacterium]|nr:pilus assembly PilX N-terminal domain-containing protein [Pseudomonadota bacterium]